MSSRLFCFSGTGNSLHVALELDKELENNEILPINDDFQIDKFDNVDKVGFIFPVYAYGMPRTVENFIGKNEFSEDVYYFAIATCGGTPGNTIKNLDKLLRKNKCKLSAGFTVKEKNHNLMEANLFMKFMIIAGGSEPDSFLKKKEQIVDIVKGNKTNKLETSSWLANKLGDMLHKTALNQLKDNVNQFYVNSKCNGCGTCVNICPKDNIELKDGEPIWSDDCESCFGCLQWCPQAAIGYEDNEGEIKRTHNMNISKNEMYSYLGNNNSNERLDQSE